MAKLSVAEHEAMAKELFNLNNKIKTMSDEAKELKAKLGDFIEAEGEADSGGSKTFKFKEFVGVRQRRVKIEIDQDKAVAKCEELGETGVVVVKKEVDEKKFQELIADEILTSQDVKKMVKESESFAIIVRKL